MEVSAVAAALSRLLRQRVWSRPSAPWPRPQARLTGGEASLLRGDNYREASERAAREPGPFWGALARQTLLWDAPHHTDCEWDWAQGRVRWFLGGRLNVAANCLDQHVQHSPNRVALIWEKDEPGSEEKVTYRCWYQLP